MAYLEVVVENNCALTANGSILRRDKGFWAYLFGCPCPVAFDYFNALEREGWRLISSRSSGSFGMIDGLPFQFKSDTYIFQGNGRYEVEWNGDNWFIKGSTYEEDHEEDYVNNYDYEEDYLDDDNDQDY